MRAVRAGSVLIALGMAGVLTAAALPGRPALASPARSWLPATPQYWPLVVGHQATRPQVITHGVAWDSQAYQTVGGAERAQVMDVDLADPNVRLGLVEAGNKLVDPADETPSSMADRTGAVAGINGDFFDINASGQPLGMVVQDGVLEASPVASWPDELEVLTDGHGDTVIVDGKARHVISYMKDFLFAAEQARQPVSVLSGGERARLLLAKALASPSNLLVLDEPTNDLDLETLDLLQEMIADYEGTVLLVSHDRDFLDRTVTSVLMSEGCGKFVEYAGGYSDMLAQRGFGLAAKAAPKSSSKAAAPRERPADTKRRMTFKDKHALEELPKKIAAAETEIASLQNALSDADLYARDPKRFAALSETLSRTQAALAEHEERWLTLEMLRAEIEG